MIYIYSIKYLYDIRSIYIYQFYSTVCSYTRIIASVWFSMVYLWVFYGFYGFLMALSPTKSDSSHVFSLDQVELRSRAGSMGPSASNRSGRRRPEGRPPFCPSMSWPRNFWGSTWVNQKCWKSFQWIGLRENPQETIDFPIKYGAFL